MFRLLSSSRNTHRTTHTEIFIKSLKSLQSTEGYFYHKHNYI